MQPGEAGGGALSLVMRSTGAVRRPQPDAALPTAQHPCGGPARSSLLTWPPPTGGLR